MLISAIISIHWYLRRVTIEVAEFNLHDSESFRPKVLLIELLLALVHLRLSLVDQVLKTRKLVLVAIDGVGQELEPIQQE